MSVFDFSRWRPLRVHLWLDGKRVVDFLLAIIELFSLALTAGALLSEICRNRRFLTGVGHLMNDVATGRFYKKKLCSRLFSTEF